MPETQSRGLAIGLRYSAGILRDCILSEYRMHKSRWQLDGPVRLDAEKPPVVLLNFAGEFKADENVLISAVEKLLAIPSFVLMQTDENGEDPITKAKQRNLFKFAEYMEKRKR